MLSKCLIVMLYGLFVICLPRAVSAQGGNLEIEIRTAYAERAERVELAGTEFRGHKTGATKFTKCNGEVIDIGDKKPTKTGPCPGDGKPNRLFAFECEIVEVNVASSMVLIRAADKKTYAVYFPVDTREVVFSTGPRATSASPVAQVFDSGSAVRARLRDLKVEELTPGSRLTIVSMLAGRAEAIIRSQ